MRGQTNKNILRPGLHKRLRKAATDAERRLWQHLRGKQIDDCKFRRQHPYYHYILDFVCIERKLVVELDGGQHAEQVQADRERDAFLAAGGFRVLRFWNHDVLGRTEAVVEAILRALSEHRQHHPHPSPPPEGEGDRQHHPHPDPPPEGEGDK